MSELITSANSAMPIGFRKKIARDEAAPEKHAAGVVFIAPDGDILLLRRAGIPGTDNFVGHWALPGGGGEEGETPEKTAFREAREELGADADNEMWGSMAYEGNKLRPLDYRVTPTGMGFHTFALPVAEKFAPKLNDEHTGYAWASLDMLPRPLHPAVEATLKDQVGVAEDMDPASVRDEFVKWSRAEAADCGATDSALKLALDKDSVRVKDRDGRLRVSMANISKANVCPYRGREIPGWDALGLDADRIYNLLRDPDELKKGADSLNGVPLLRKHIPVSADDHQPHDVVGSIGTDANFDGEYVTNSLFVNARDAIDGIESGKKRELSAGYHYTPDMTPGNFRGTRYDGVMRDIVFNHVALVEDGRAGPDVVVGDSTENLHMKPTRLAATALAVVGAYLSPRLALDATLPKPLFSDLNTKNFATKKGEIVTAVLAASKGKLRRGVAMDDGGGLAKLLDALEDSTKGADESVSEKQHEAMEAAAQGNSEIGIPKAVGEEFVDRDTGKKKPGMDGEAVKEWLRGKGMGEDDLAEFDTTFPPAVAGQDEDDDEDEEKKKAAAKLKEAEDSMKNMVTKPAMDAALKAHGETVAKQVRDNERGIRVACATVKDWIGEVPASLAFDSASDVYRHALGALGVESAKTLHADALLPVLQAQAKPGAKPSVHLTTPALGMDEAARNSMKAVLGDINLDRIGTA